MLELGSMFAHYRIQSLLGAGGMGQVYLAFDETLRREVALKVLLRSTPDDVARMVREARAVAAVEHPNKVTVFELGEVEGAPYIAMELIRGRTLRALADSPGERAWEDDLSMLLDAARALAAGHAAGLLHRDVKPDNVMLREDGIVKVLDFGIARRSAVSVDVSASTAFDTSGVIVGTAAYMAPEQVRGDDLDGRCDQFAWGIMAFELLTGEHPWGGGRDGLQLVSRMLTTEPRELSSVRPELPAALADAIRRTLSRDREDRFATFGDLLTSLDPRVGRSERRVRLAPPEGDVSVSAPTVEAPPRSGARTTAGLEATASGPKGSPRWTRAFWFVVVLASAAFAFSRVFAPDGAGVDETPATARATAEAPSIPASGAEPLPSPPARPPPRYYCHPDLQDRTEYGLRTVPCGNDARSWCDAAGKVIACCAYGLVASGRDGACMCPPLADDAGRALGCEDAKDVPQPDPEGFAARGESVRAAVGKCFAGSKAKRSHTLHFWLDYSPEGEVASAKILESDAFDPAMQSCALAELRGLRRWPNRGGSGAMEMKWEVGDGAAARDARPAPGGSATP